MGSDRVRARIVIVGAGFAGAYCAQALERELGAIRAEYLPAEPEMQYEVKQADLPSQVWDDASTARALRLVNGLPHGVVAMSYEIKGLVETSTNLAVVSEQDGALSILMSSRSSVASALARPRALEAKKLKQIVKAVVPSSVRPQLRRMWNRTRSIGLSHQCPICGSRLRAFLPHGNTPDPNCVCPVCASKAPHRLAWLYLQKQSFVQSMRGMIFEAPILRQLKKKNE